MKNKILDENKVISEPIFKIENVTLGYGKKNVIVKDLTLNIKKGDFVSIIGPNGSGKSTILRSMAKILHPQKGKIKYANRDINFSLKNYLYYLISHFYKLPIDKIYLDDLNENVLNNISPSKELLKELNDKYYLSKVYTKAKTLGFKENELFINKELLPINKILIKVQKFCKLNNIKFDKEIHYKKNQTCLDIQTLNKLKSEDINKYNYCLINNYALTLKANEGDLIYSPIQYRNVYINKFIKYLRKHKVSIKNEYYLTENNPFLVDEWKNNYWVMKKINSLTKWYKFFGFQNKKDNTNNQQLLLYSFDKTFYLAKEYSKHVSFVPQITNFPSEITVEEFVMMGRYPHNKVLNFVSKEEDIQKVHQALDNVNLLEMKDKYIDDLSGGQKQRAIIALALAQDTETILLDEPTNHLDIRHQLEIIHLLHDLNHKLKKTIILVIHDINHGMKFSDKIVIMNHGQAIEYGPTNNVINKEIIKDVFGVDANVALSQNKKIITDYWIEDLELLKDYHDDDKQE